MTLPRKGKDHLVGQLDDGVFTISIHLSREGKDKYLALIGAYDKVFQSTFPMWQYHQLKRNLALFRRGRCPHRPERLDLGDVFVLT